jgi:hypothetical protein
MEDLTAIMKILLRVAFAKAHIELKLHSVIARKNHLSLPDQVVPILDSIKGASGQVACWKFFQYMSYDAPE